MNDCLCQKDVVYKESGVLLSIRHTKTIQCNERILQVPLPIIHDSPLCPVSALKRLVNVRGEYKGKQPLFSYKEGSSTQVLTYSSFLTILQAVMKACDLNADQYSGHSLRRAGATYAFSRGVPPMLIKAQGDWKSQAYQAYVDISLDQQWHMVKCLSQDL
jgi:integrase